MQGLSFRICFGIGMLLLLSQCSREEPLLIPKEFRSDFSGKEFEAIERLMYNLQFPNALEKIKGLVDQQELNSRKQQEAYLQAAFLSLSLEQTAKGKYWIRRFFQASPDSTKWSNSLKAHYYLVKGMALYQEFYLFEAKTSLQKSLPLLQKTYTNNHYYTAVALTQLGLILFDIDFTQVLVNEYIEQAEAIFQYNPTLSNFSWEMYLGKALQAQNDRAYLNVKSAVAQALYTCENLPFKLSIFRGRCFLALGNALKKLAGQPNHGNSNYNSADSCFQLAEKLIQTSNSIRLQECYRDRCVLYIHSSVHQKRFESQLQELIHLIEIQKRDVFGFPDRLSAYYDYINSGLDISSTQLIKDKASAQRVINAYTNFFHKNKNNSYHCRHLDEVLFILRRTYALTENYAKAIYYSKKSTELFQPHKHSAKYQSIVGVPMDTNEVAAWIGCGWLAEYQFLAAQKLKGVAKITKLQKAIELYLLFDSHFFTSILNTNEDVLLGFQNEVGDFIYPNAVAACYEYHQILGNESSLNLALQFSERRKSYLLYRDMLKQNLDQATARDSVRLWQSEWNKLFFVLNQQPKTAQKELWLRLNQVERKLKQAIQNKTIDTLAYRKEIRQPCAKLQDIQTQLKEDQQVLQYVIGENQLYILATNKKKCAFTKVDVATDSLKHWVALFLGALNNYQGFPTASQNQTYLKYAHQLYKCLVQPVKNTLDSAKTTIIIPDQYLHLLPFEALLKQKVLVKGSPDFKKLPYFLLNGPIVYSPSWKVYSEKSKRDLSQITSSEASFWAAPDVLNTQQLKSSLQHIFGQNLRIFQGSACTRAAFLRELPKLKGLVHLSVHARSSIYDRLENKLLFPTPTPKNGEVYGFEISALNLQEIDLLVLAACQSSFGQAGAEGAFSLARCFSQAGVGSIVGTLWSVDNGTTNQLLDWMYHHLEKKQALEKALWLAKKKFIVESQFGFPGAWAGVIIN